MTALKPCPMGCPASFAAIENVDGFQRVKCDCGWTGPKRKNSVRAIAAWNRRADAPELMALVDAAKASLEPIKHLARNERLTDAQTPWIGDLIAALTAPLAWAVWLVMTMEIRT